MTKTPALILTLIIVASPALGEEEQAPELEVRYRHYYVTYTLNEDGSNVMTRDWAQTVLAERAVQAMKQASISYSTSIEEAQITEAYTLKPDGRRIDVPKDNYQVKVNKGKDKDSPVFSDITTLNVVFPDVEVGDTVAFSYKITETEPMFPGHFSVVEVYPRTIAYDDLRVTIDAPSSLQAQYEGRQMTQEVSERNGRKTVTWRYANKQPAKSKRFNYTVYDLEQDPGLSYSTFRSYADIAEAYGRRAHPKAVVTERVKALADKIVDGIEEPGDQARALYGWVAVNISYAGNCIGVGAVVPHDIPFVLDNRMGDCKDHATLLQALLAAMGIPSTQALINASSIYRLPRIPVASTVNHVLNYIPSLDLYADATSATTPFGMLPFPVADKPVLLVEGYKDGARTPPIPVGANRQYMKSTLQIAADGRVTGDIEFDFKGLYAVAVRSVMRNLTKAQEGDLVENIFRRGGYIGSGTIDREDASALRDTYSYKVSFELRDFLSVPGPSAFKIMPMFPSEHPIHRFLDTVFAPDLTEDIACASGYSIEEYTYEFPDGMEILAVPNNMQISNDFLSYTADYQLEGNKLTVKRVLDDRTARHVCSPEMDQAYKEFGAKVLQNLKAQVVYK